MTETAIIFTPKYHKHKTEPNHPENPKRLKVIMKELKKMKLFAAAGQCRLVSPDMAGMEDLLLVHDSDYIKLVKLVCKGGGGLLDLGDTVVAPESFEVARYAAGGALKAVDLILNEKCRNAFALVRPPGHHAGPYYAGGFCVFNNVAIAAAHLIRRLGFERVLILDVDAHHGNGTQDIFYGTQKVLYISLHEDPRGFPGTGFVDEVGECEGIGFTVNVPFPFGTGDNAYLKAFDDIVVPIIRQYKPQFVLASIGYDGCRNDPVAKLNLSAIAFALIIEKTLHMAATICQGRFAGVLEGGYNLTRLGRLVVSTISKMADFPYAIEEETIPANLRVEREAEKAIKEVKETQSAFWDLEH